MCGRVGYTITRLNLLAAYPWLRDTPEPEPRYNVAPTDPVVVVDGTDARLVTWGTDGTGAASFNVRSESLLRRDPARLLAPVDRVVVPASHFYEWRLVGSRRLPVAIRRRDGAPISLAGLLGRRDGAPAVAILTTTPNRDLAPVHDRMPVVLSDADARAWAREELSPAQLAAMLRPCPDGLLETRPASPLVNSVRNDGPELLDPAALPEHYQLDLLDPEARAAAPAPERP
jgi:putative SOS response-associated peptidase YedK